MSMCQCSNALLRYTSASWLSTPKNTKWIGRKWDGFSLVEQTLIDHVGGETNCENCKYRVYVLWPAEKMCTKTNVLVFNWTFWLINMVMFAGHSIWVALTHLHTRRSHVNNTQTFDTDLDVLLSLKKITFIYFCCCCCKQSKSIRCNLSLRCIPSIYLFGRHCHLGSRVWECQCQAKAHTHTHRPLTSAHTHTHSSPIFDIQQATKNAWSSLLSH